jgi:3-hydroxymyristoyl/3-hydroxydecanoyl-(acyl carrier protein) dehydratase
VQSRSKQIAGLPDPIEQQEFGMTFEVRRVIRADHHSLPGHFPGRPLVPGVVILDEVLAALIEWRENSQLTGIQTVKFLAPLKPEQPFTISLSAKNESAGEINFCCRAEDRVIVEGRLEVCWGAK